MTRSARIAAAACAAVLGVAAAAAAQSPARGYELTIAGTVTGPSSFGSSDANLLTPGGTDLTLFSSTNDLKPGYGIELHLARPLTSRLSLEGSGTLTRATLRSRITDDFEDVADVEITERLMRFTVEGSAIITLSSSQSRSFFVRAGAGWMRELAGDGAFLEDGVVVNAGAGLTSWFRNSGGRRLGLRIEGRAQLRKSGITLGADKLRFSPVVSGGLLIGF